MKTSARLFARLHRALKRSPVEAAVITVMVLVVAMGFAPAMVAATEGNGSLQSAETNLVMRIAAMQNATKPYGIFPECDLRGPSYTMTVSATAYNSLPEQTDSTPFITASGTHVRHGVLAANFLPIGTKVKIPALYGDQVFVVEDRMNPRYTQRVDIWMESYDDARQFGVRTIEIEIYQ